MKIFIHHDGALGDVLLSLPAIRTVSAEASLVHFAGRNDVAAFLCDAGAVGEGSSSGSGRYAAWYSGMVDEAGREFLKRFDRAVVFTVDQRSPFIDAVRRELPATRVIVTVPPAGSPVHAAQYRMDQLEDLPGSTDGPILPLPPLLPEVASGLLRRAGYDGRRSVVALHPGSGGREKNWPLDRFIALAEALRGRLDPFLIFFTGPAEDDVVRERIDAAARNRLGILHLSGAELITVAALLRLADLYIGNDSGVSHLAASVGCPAIVLFGPTDPDIWRPQGRQVEIVRASSLAGIPVSLVADRLHQLLPPVRAEKRTLEKEQLTDACL